MPRPPPPSCMPCTCPAPSSQESQLAQRERELTQTRSEHKEQLEKLTFDLREGRQKSELAQSEKEQVIKAVGKECQ